MLSCCLIYRKNTGNKQPRVSKANSVQCAIAKYPNSSKTKNLWIFASIRNENSFEQNSFLEWYYIMYYIICTCIKINNIFNKFLLAIDKFMSEMHLRQPGSRYSTCGPFTKNKTRIPKFKESGDSRYIY